QIAGGAAVAVPGLTAEPGREVTIGVRPEHLTLGASGIAGKVTIVEPTGADTQVSAISEAGEISAIFRERHDFKPGDAIVLTPQPGTAHVFDAQSGKRL
ncbi:MAG TPA: TOBE domain-containing protein, partial [Burkholderiaceae bacterium]|nr:TOBE domain-containing protein [Burkholderiaceae bacterium]